MENFHMAQSSNPLRKLTSKLSDPRLWFLIASLAILLPLIIYAYMGIFSRYQADDYCLAWNGTSKTFLRAQTTWYKTDSSRYAATLIFTLSDKLGRWTVQAFPAFMLTLWLTGSFWLIHLIQKKLNLAFPLITSFFFAELMVYFLLLLVPNLYQILYWRSGMVVYLLPLVLLTYLAIFLLLQASKTSNWRYLAAPLATLFFFFNGGFSETIATIQIGLLGLVIFSLIILKNVFNRKWAIFLLICALVGSLLAIATLFFSPATLMRQGLLGAAPGLVDLVRMSFSNAFIFLYITLGDKAFPLVILMFTSLMSGYILYSTQLKDSKLRVTNLVSALLLTPVIIYLLIVCVCAPIAYGESSYPEGRVLLNAMFFMVVMIIVEGLILGINLGLLHQRSNESVPIGLRTISLLLLVIMSFYPLYSSRKVLNDIPEYQQRAVAWDSRDAQIRNLIKQRQKNITVTAFDSIAGLMELGPDPSNWVNRCAALYYGAHSITAELP
jgi:hypothetical protein